MAKRREQPEELAQTKRISPYQQMDDLQEDALAQNAAYEDADADAYEDAYDDYDVPYADDEYEDEEDAPQGGFFSTLLGKIVLGVIALLVAVLIALLAISFLRKPDQPADLPAAQATAAPVQSTKAPVLQQATNAPGAIVFAPVAQETQKPTAQPTQAPTQAPTGTPEATGTPLPIILTNTPTPSPSPTPTATPSPSPVPTPTPTPEPTEAPVLSLGEVNRKANLREKAASNAKVKQSIDKGETVTIHEALLDQDGKTWYNLTVDDLAVNGWMRDYVVDLAEKIAKPTFTPNPEATPKAEAEKETAEKTTPEPTATPNPEVIGTGKTTKEANVRKVMNGKVLVQLKKGKKVDILATSLDKNGKLWYEVKPQGSNTVGFVRDYLIRLDEDVEIEKPTATPKVTATPKAEQEDAPVVPENEPKEENILDREVIGKAKTNRAANVRVKPVAGGKLVRQLSQGVELLILEKYEDKSENIWYEVSTQTGNTHGFVRDYVIKITEIDKDREAKTYGEE